MNRNQFKYIFPTLILTTFFTTACSTTPHKPYVNEIDVLLVSATKQISQTQQELYLAGALNEVVIQKPAVITGEALYSFIWEGDAAKLLAKIAHDQRLQFNTSGTEVPLPVSLRVENQTFNNTLHLIQSQINYRAHIIQKNERLTLDYNNFTH